MSVTEDPTQWVPKGPNKLDLRIPVQEAEYNKLCEVFPIVANIDQENFRVVYGVHGRSPIDPNNPNYTQSDIMEIYQYDDLDNYLVPFGGLATSCVYDGFEVAKYVAEKFGLAKHKDFERLQWLMEHEKNLPNLLQGVPERSEDENDLARWER